MESELNKAELAFLTGGTVPDEPEKTEVKSTEKSKAKTSKNSTEKSKVKSVQKSKVKNTVKYKAKNKGTGLFDDIGKPEKLERFTIDLTPDLAQQFKDIAKARNIPRAKLLRAIMKRAFDDMQQ